MTTSHHTKRSTPQRWLLVTLLVVLSAEAVQLASQNPTIARAWTMATTHQAEDFTSLAFVDGSHVANKLAPGTTHTVRFAVGNHHATDRAIRFQASLVDRAGKVTILKTGEVFVGSGHTIEVPLTLTAPAAGTSYTLVVALPDTGVTIHVKEQA